MNSSTGFVTYESCRPPRAYSGIYIGQTKLYDIALCYKKTVYRYIRGRGFTGDMPNTFQTRGRRVPLPHECCQLKKLSIGITKSTLTTETSKHKVYTPLRQKSIRGGHENQPLPERNLQCFFRTVLGFDTTGHDTGNKTFFLLLNISAPLRLFRLQYSFALFRVDSDGEEVYEVETSMSLTRVPAVSGNCMWYRVDHINFTQVVTTERLFSLLGYGSWHEVE